MEMDAINSSKDDKGAGVTVRNAYKKYKTGQVILNGLNMTVLKGTIYGLLGPSGCGKSTLLHCILGRIKLDSGEIRVTVKTRANIGYMPQETALYEELRIIEIMTYYGRIFGLDNHQVEKRTEELSEFLELPSKSKIINRLSGGQHRRVSFAIALLHNPSLLFLDEPTAGVDRLLCARIWNKLQHMVEHENKTIIVTTHYIQESCQAHIIGLMREGKILAEDSPFQLMERYGSSNLEDTFLHLCQSQMASYAEETHNKNSDSSCMLKNMSQIPSQPNFKCSKKILFAILTKNFYWMRRNKLIMFIILFLPLINCVLFSSCVGNDPIGLKLAIVNEEFPQISHCNRLPSAGCNFSSPLSCRYLKKLQQKSYELQEYQDIDQAKLAVEKNQVWGLVYFSKNYTSSIHERIMLKQKASDITFVTSEAQIWLDLSNEHIALLLKKNAVQGCLEFLQELFSDCGWPPKVPKSFLRIEKPIYGSHHLNFRHSASTALLTSFQFNLPMSFTLESLLMERRTNSFDRSLISGVTILEVAISLIIIQFIILSIQSTVMMLVLFVLYDSPLIGSLSWIISILIVTGASGMSYGFLIALLCNTDQAALYMGIGSQLTTFLTTGVLWPLEGMHHILRPICNILPATRSAKALQALAAKDWPVTSSTVYESYISNFGWTGVFILATLIIVKKKEKLKNKSS